MTKFIENVNAYLAGRSIKKNYVSTQSGIDVKKLSRILTGVQDVTGTDMEKIAASLGHPVEFFLQDKFTVPSSPDTTYYPYYPVPSKQDTELNTFVLQLVELLRNADVVLSSNRLPEYPTPGEEVFL